MKNQIRIISSSRRTSSSVLALALLVLIVQQMVVTVSSSQPVASDESPESKESDEDERVMATVGDIGRAMAADGQTAIKKVFGSSNDSSVVDCYWVGVAPFCDGQCSSENNAETSLTDERGDGMRCWTGTKHYCCPIKQ